MPLEWVNILKGAQPCGTMLFGCQQGGGGERGGATSAVPASGACPEPNAPTAPPLPPVESRIKSIIRESRCASVWVCKPSCWRARCVPVGTRAQQLCGSTVARLIALVCLCGSVICN